MLDSFKKFLILLFPILLLAVIAFLLLGERMDLTYTLADKQLDFLPSGVLQEKKEYRKLPADCLLLRDSTQENSEVFTEHMESVLEEIRVPYDLVDIARETIPAFSSYKTVVIVFQHLDAMQDKILDLCDWVEQDGGRVMLFCTPDASPVYRFLSSRLGVEEGGISYAFISGLKVKDGAMLGGDGFIYHWEEPMATALSVRLRPDARVYITSDDENEVPLLWATDDGKGRFVVNNHGMAEKSTRGLSSVAYSLLEDVSIHPVINASAFFLDDFPSPVPMGDGQYIRRDYHRDIGSFYSNVWWPDMMELCDDFGIRYTGMIIEDYSEEVAPPFAAAPDQERFNYFGALLLDRGGEIGIHGYNHMPLCLQSFDFKDQVDYVKFKSTEDMAESLRTVMDFTKKMYPDVEPACYVPPSNILSMEGKQAILDTLPEIKIFSGLYLEGVIEYTQEFCVNEDGTVELPRVISGANIDEYMYWAALNALNIYYVNTHFMHPDDTLDEDRGAAMGWEKLYQNFRNYLNWLYTAAPNIRNFTASDAAKAVERFDVVSLERTDTEDSIRLRIHGFWDEAQFLVRVNNGTPGKVDGGALTHISGDFYLLAADTANVSISLEG